MKAEGLSTFTGFRAFLPHVSLPIWNQGGAITKGSLILLILEGFFSSMDPIRPDK